MFSFSLYKYSRRELLDHIVALFSIFWGTSILFSIVTAPSYIPTTVHKGFLLFSLKTLLSLSFPFKFKILITKIFLLQTGCEDLLSKTNSCTCALMVLRTSSLRLPTLTTILHLHCSSLCLTKRPFSFDFITLLFLSFTSRFHYQRFWKHHVCFLCFRVIHKFHNCL